MIVLNGNAYDLYGIDKTDHFAESRTATPMEYLSFNQTQSNTVLDGISKDKGVIRSLIWLFQCRKCIHRML